MSLALYLSRVTGRGIRRFLADTRAYDRLNRDERHLFWKKLQAVLFLALMPVFLALGLAHRAISRLLPVVR